MPACCGRRRRDQRESEVFEGGATGDLVRLGRRRAEWALAAATAGLDCCDPGGWRRQNRAMVEADGEGEVEEKDLGRRMNFSLHKKTGKKCFTIAPRDLMLAGLNDPIHFISVPEEVSRLSNVVRGSIVRVGVQNSNVRLFYLSSKRGVGSGSGKKQRREQASFSSVLVVAVEALLIDDGNGVSAMEFRRRLQRVEMATTEPTGLQSDPPAFQESGNLKSLSPIIGVWGYLGCQPKYLPPEFVGSRDNVPQTSYSCYLIELNKYCYKKTQLQNVILALRTRLESDDEKLSFELRVDGGSWIHRCQRFQVIVFRVLLDRNLNKLDKALGRFNRVDGSAVIDYLLLPSIGPVDNPPMHTKNGLLFSCLLENSLVWTPHNGNLYCVVGILDDLDEKRSYISKTLMIAGMALSYAFETEPFLNGKHIPMVQNYLHRGEARKIRESSTSSVELPPELCDVIMSPVPIATLYSFSCVPSIMHRFESLLIASRLKKLCTDHCAKSSVIPTSKILEAITTNLCQENFHLESLETLGDSFLKYASSRHVFKTNPNDPEGALTAKRERMISNSLLYKLGCNCNIPGFIRNEQFDPKTWVVPGVWNFLGTAVLDYAITAHLYDKYPGLSPGCLTELRSASVNNTCYALSSVKAGLHNHILHSSTALQSLINDAVQDIKQSSASSTFGWELEASFPKVLGDIIESIAGAIYLDSGFKADIVFQKIRLLLEPMVTPESLRLNPVKELTELCQKRKYRMEAPVETYKNGEAYITLEVVANGAVHRGSSSARSKKTAIRLACKSVLKLLEPET
nr:endoribonuclease Dicer homolog 2-like [Ipomoea batatas]